MTAPLPLSAIPSLGSAFDQLRLMRNDRIGGLLRFNEELKDVGRFGFVFGDVVLANSPELVHEVLVSKAKAFEKSPILRGALYPLAGQGLFTSEGELWRKQRKLMAPMFQHAAIQPFAADMTRAAERCARGLADGAVVDMAREMTRVTMAIAGSTLFDADLFDDADELGAALTTALDWAGTQSSSVTLIAQARAAIGLGLLADHSPPKIAAQLRAWSERAMQPIMWPTDRNRELERAIALLDARVALLIEARRQGESKRDLLSLLLHARDDEAGAMSDKQVRDEVLTLFVAGHETTAAALTWGLMLLGQHPEVMAALRSEVDALGRVPSFDDLPRLPLSLRVFKESMRLYPPVYMFGRVAVTDVEVDRYMFPKGTVVLVSPFALHRRADIWPDPARFDPDRFLPQEEAKRHKNAFIPFSAGPRTCIGNHFALMEGPLVLATLLHYADFELCDPRGAEPDPQATLRPKGGLPMRVRRREGSARQSD